MRGDTVSCCMGTDGGTWGPVGFTVDEWMEACLISCTEVTPWSSPQQMSQTKTMIIHLLGVNGFDNNDQDNMLESRLLSEMLFRQNCCALPGNEGD